jgi:hypothetical protein
LLASNKTTNNHLESSTKVSRHHLQSFTKMGILTYEWKMKDRKSESSVGRRERKGKGEGVVGFGMTLRGRVTS